MTTLLNIECFKRADKMPGGLKGDNLVKALQSIKNFDVGGLMPPVTIKENSIPVGRVYGGTSKTRGCDPLSVWIHMD
jgi:branched-chain amino acid transport system substrate-binding protein